MKNNPVDFPIRIMFGFLCGFYLGWWGVGICAIVAADWVICEIEKNKEGKQ